MQKRVGENSERERRGREKERKKEGKRFQEENHGAIWGTQCARDTLPRAPGNHGPPPEKSGKK